MATSVDVAGVSMHLTIEKLKERKVVQWAFAYLAAAWLVVQAVDVLGERWGLTAQIARVIDVFVVIVLAWYHGDRGRQRVRAVEILLTTAIMGGAAGVLWFSLGGSPVESAPGANRIMVFPLAVSGDTTLAPSSGEDVATMIGAALDGTEPLRWIDAWPLLQESTRADIRLLQIPDAAELAMSRGAGAFVWGRLISRTDSAEVVLTLYESATAEGIATAHVTGTLDAPWKAGLRAVNSLLPRLISTSIPDIEADLRDRVPAAVVQFLAGEAAFRRANISEAREHFGAAFSIDTTFALAAMRGAQTAAWQHDAQAAERLIQAALRLPLTARSESFARGILAYVKLDGDEAARHLQVAVRADSTLAVAWAALGEVYRHRAPRDAWTSGARPFERAVRVDSTAGPVLFHRLEEVMRDGDLESASILRRRFLEGDPDSSLRHQIDAMFRCLDEGPASTDWRSHVLRGAANVEFAAAQYLIGARNLPCAEALFRSIVRFDTTSTNAEARYWAGLLGLTGSRLAQHDLEGARRIVEAAASGYEAFQSLLENSQIGADGLALPRGDASLSPGPRPLRQIHEESLTRWSELAVLIGLLYPPLSDLADRGADELRANVGADYKGPRAFRTSVQMLGVWEAYRGSRDEATRAAERLKAMSEGYEDAVMREHTSTMAETVLIHRAIADGRDQEALQRLRSLRSKAQEGWIFVELHGSLSHERLVQAALEISVGDPGKAFALTAGFDEPASLAHILYLPRALYTCARAASITVRPAEAQSCESRLLRLGWSLAELETY
jgi:tetratricopeptide (TPR) repeat protein